MVLYVGLAGSPIVGATLLFLFSLGMGVSLVIGAMAMARILQCYSVSKKSSRGWAWPALS
jgi:cytochrome c biogenesis protein CcdA